MLASRFIPLESGFTGELFVCSTTILPFGSGSVPMPNTMRLSRRCGGNDLSQQDRWMIFADRKIAICNVRGKMMRRLSIAIMLAMLTAAGTGVVAVCVLLACGAGTEEMDKKMSTAPWQWRTGETRNGYSTGGARPVSCAYTDDTAGAIRLRTEFFILISEVDSFHPSPYYK